MEIFVLDFQYRYLAFNNYHKKKSVYSNYNTPNRRFQLNKNNKNVSFAEENQSNCSSDNILSYVCQETYIEKYEIKRFVEQFEEKERTKSKREITALVARFCNKKQPKAWRELRQGDRF